MTSTTLQLLLETAWLPVLQLGSILLLAPFINTFLKKLKALMQGRKGPPWGQGYFDLLKYFHKETVVSQEASWLFLITPAIVFAILCLASLMVPTFTLTSPFQTLANIILFLYLLGLARFLSVSAAMEAGSGFCGMASSREMMFASLIEPVMLLSLFALVVITGSSNFFEMGSRLAHGALANSFSAYAVAIVAFFIASLAELGRLPFDNPETHYELTMIHEGMLLEYSGKPLGMMIWAAWVKQLLILSLLANFILPVDLLALLPPGSLLTSNLLISFCLYLVKLFVLCGIVALIETTFAKLRLFRVKDILGTAFVMGMIALLLTTYTGGHP